MATASFLSSGLHVYECQICLNDLLKRICRILPCGHYFCHECLEKLADNSRIKCPTCRRDEPLPKGGVAGFPLNFSLTIVKDREKEIYTRMHKTCIPCILQGQNSEAIFKCTQCFQAMCEKCKKKHDSVPLFKDHIVNYYSEKCVGTCARHGLLAEYSCTHCWRQLCTQCLFTGDHTEHYDEIRSKQQLSDLAESSIKECTAVITNVKEKIDLHLQNEKTLVEIKQTFVDYIDNMYLGPTVASRKALQYFLDHITPMEEKLQSTATGVTHNMVNIKNIFDNAACITNKAESYRQHKTFYPKIEILCDIISGLLEKLIEIKDPSLMPEKSSTLEDAPRISTTTPIKSVPSFEFGSEKMYIFKPVSPVKRSEEKADSETDLYLKPVIKLPDEAELKTGEEEEDVLFINKARLFRFVSGEWKERGVGNMKVLRNRDSGKARLLMRRDQVLKTCCNHAISSNIKLMPMDAEEGKAWVWHAEDFTEGEQKHELFGIRFKTEDVAKSFKEAVEDAGAKKKD